MSTINFILSDQLKKNLETIKKREGITGTSEMLRFLIKYYYYSPPRSIVSEDELIAEHVRLIEEKVSAENPNTFSSLQDALADV